jgi:hypothetical protein
MNKILFNYIGIVTRSRTGSAKPKTLDEDNYEIPTPKRKASTVLTDSPASRKRMRMEVTVAETTVPSSDNDEEANTIDVEISNGGSSKKMVIIVVIFCIHGYHDTILVSLCSCQNNNKVDLEAYMQYE